MNQLALAVGTLLALILCCHASIRNEPHKGVLVHHRTRRPGLKEVFVTSTHRGDINRKVFCSDIAFQTLADSISKKVLSLQAEFNTLDLNNEDFPDWFEGHAAISKKVTCMTSTRTATCTQAEAHAEYRITSVRHNFVEWNLTFTGEIRLRKAPGTVSLRLAVAPPANLSQQHFALSASPPWPLNEQISFNMPAHTPVWLQDKALVIASQRPQVGHSVGILVRRHWKLTAEDVDMTEIEFAKLDVPRFYGKQDQTALLTGTITAIHDDVIEYDINTYAGCSGSPVIYLDSVDMHSAGEQIGSHCGSNGGHYNVGFLLRELALHNQLDNEK